ncbi:N-acetylmuramoyl-L-alanine amidase [Ochotona princeps]|uniref:N-acetylmuramoyl-L-alanine amidase n=1 Tax=Ochotona princeps TaxID=9978 RepID=UPI0027145A21|nr:N-acetylmuramoyl-L-alanine amidase [Ochotona princeps]
MAPHVFWIALGLLLWQEPGSASLSLRMESVIQVLKELEQDVRNTEAGHAASAWLRAAQDTGPHNPLHPLLLLTPAFQATALGDHCPLSPEFLNFIKQVTRHDIQDGQEYGVVLAPDGSTVALEPLLMGLQAGEQEPGTMTLTLALSAGAAASGDNAESPSTADSLLVTTLARYLGLAFLQNPRPLSRPGLGTEGCWDQLSSPRNFTLLAPTASTLTMAFLNGALDGILLGYHLRRTPEPRPALSLLLSQYYGAGVAGDPKFRSNFRRQNMAALALAPSLDRQVLGALVLLQRLEPAHPQLWNVSQDQLAQVATRAAKEFTEAYLGCPAIHPRCRWGAAPYRGQPRSLHLPLGFLYVHHTYEPASPCTSFTQCAQNMRSMQRFHQDTRGWDDLGYSFVVGSDGYMYEGRGWHWLGAHTFRHNSLGFGVAFVGNYTAALPTEVALRSVRDQLPRCALRAGFLQPQYKVLGHRQLVSTDCPGDALFQELHTWPHFVSLHSFVPSQTGQGSRNLITPA